MQVYYTMMIKDASTLLFSCVPHPSLSHLTCRNSLDFKFHWQQNKPTRREGGLSYISQQGREGGRKGGTFLKILGGLAIIAGSWLAFSEASDHRMKSSIANLHGFRSSVPPQPPPLLQLELVVNIPHTYMYTHTQYTDHERDQGDGEKGASLS